MKRLFRLVEHLLAGALPLWKRGVRAPAREGEQITRTYKLDQIDKMMDEITEYVVGHGMLRPATQELIAEVQALANNRGYELVNLKFDGGVDRPMTIHADYARPINVS